MRVLLAIAVASYLSGCAAISERPALRVALFTLGAAVVVGEVGQVHGVSSAPTFQSPSRPPPPFDPCAGSRDCAK